MRAEIDVLEFQAAVLHEPNIASEAGSGTGVTPTFADPVVISVLMPVVMFAFLRAISPNVRIGSRRGGIG
jgi:hypothetical protein